TLLLVRLDADAGTLNVMSIPRDTRVQIPGFGMDKVNQANVLGGPSLVAQTLGYNLGNIQVDRYLRINTTAFREMVDLVGGIEVNVPTRMEYTDRTQELYIDLYPGWQTLNGDQAEQFARYRKESGDIGRVQRQQILLKALRERLTNPAVLPKLPQAIRVLQRYVDTNLTLEEMLAIANFGLGIESDQMQMVMLPGRFSTTVEFNASYWLPDWGASAEIMQSFFQAEEVGVYADHPQERYVADSAIAIQNASGQPEQAASVARYLRENGFSNVYLISDWPSSIARTEVVAQRGDIESARMVESLLGTGRSLSESTGDLNSDITIRVGRDWTERTAQTSDVDP
ncbi:MAG: LCP family protein, partial [Nodosilinea sp.]